MEAPNGSPRLAGLSAALRVFSLARGLLALVGLAAVLAVAAPSMRDRIAWQGPVSTAAGVSASQALENARPGPVRSEPDAREHEQRAVAEFISKRYRVADEAIAAFVSSAYRAGAEQRVDPLLILAVVAVESRFNPVAESMLGAKGLMQVLPKFHQDKLFEHGGDSALLDPEINIQVGTQILREYLRRFGEIETALQMYAGAFDEPTSQYAGKVLAERSRLAQMIARLRRAAA